MWNRGGRVSPLSPDGLSCLETFGAESHVCERIRCSDDFRLDVVIAAEFRVSFGVSLLYGDQLGSNFVCSLGACEMFGKGAHCVVSLRGHLDCSQHRCPRWHSSPVAADLVSIPGVWSHPSEAKSLHGCSLLRRRLCPCLHGGVSFPAWRGRDGHSFHLYSSALFSPCSRPGSWR